jgi:hypothetical protein
VTIEAEQPPRRLSMRPILTATGRCRFLGGRMRFILAGTLVYLLARPLLAVLHELLVFLAGALLGRLGTSGTWAALHGQLPLDPVYTSTMFLLLSNVQVSGVALAEPFGSALHAVWPTVFSAPGLVADGAWVSAVIQPGASVIARGLASLGAAVVFLALGVSLALLGLGRGGAPPGSAGVPARPIGAGDARAPSRDHRWLAVFGTLLQAHVVADHLPAEPVSLGDLEATGLTYGFSVLFSGPAADRPRLSALLLALPEPARDGLLVGAAVLLAYGLALLVVLLPLLAWRLPGALRSRWPRRAAAASARASAGRRQPALARAGLAAFALLFAASPLDSLADAESHYLAPEPELEVVGAPLATVLPPAPAAVAPSAAGGSTATEPPPVARPPAATRPPSAHRDPSIPPPRAVEVAGSGFQYTYTVRGRPQVIRGMGYNPTYGSLPPEERAARYDRDFAMLRAAGVNTLVGWVTHDFDRLLLDKAHQHGLGVILPYDLPWSLDYTDPSIREALMRDALDRVAQFKDHPAIRMWGPGNEVLHKLVFPSWLHWKGDPVYEARADAFATFYVELIDRIHALDPDHPVVYRDAEDGYVIRLRDALLRDGVRRPWFVYGINIYTTRLAEVIAAWPSYGLDSALLISEFGPGGAGPADRPHGYRELWQIIRSQPRYVLGGAPYVWTTQGPEEADRIFGMVDRDAKPVDGSFAAISRIYRGEAAAEPADAAGAERACSSAVAEVARATIADLQAAPYDIQFQARTPPVVIGQLDNLPPDLLRPADFRFERTGDPARRAWQRQTGSGEEWWVTWHPPSRPAEQVAMLIREGPELVELAYIYHGPASASATAWRCDER